MPTRAYGAAVLRSPTRSSTYSMTPFGRYFTPTGREIACCQLQTKLNKSATTSPGAYWCPSGSCWPLGGAAPATCQPLPNCLRYLRRLLRFACAKPAFSHHATVNPGCSTPGGPTSAAQHLLCTPLTS